MSAFIFAQVSTAHATPHHIVGRDTPANPCENASTRALTDLSPAERMAYALKPRKLTGFDACLQATTSRVQPARGWVRTV